MHDYMGTYVCFITSDIVDFLFLYFARKHRVGMSFSLDARQLCLAPFVNYFIIILTKKCLDLQGIVGPNLVYRNIHIFLLRYSMNNDYNYEMTC